MLLLFLSISITIAYLLWGVAVINGLNLYSAPKEISENDLLSISVVVPFRIEENNLAELFKSLDGLTYPLSHFEVVLVDDHSTDASLKIARNWELQTKINAHVVGSQTGSNGKKHAQARGISIARHPIVACTDADCILPPNWPQAINNAFQDDDTQLAFGPVSLKGKSNGFQRLEFNALIASTMAMLQLKWPVMGNGANMAFRKKIFEQHQKSLDLIHSASGDDVFLLQSVDREGGKVVALPVKDALVKTSPQTSIKDLFNQRLRWASKAKFYKSRVPILVGLLVFGINALLFFLAIYGVLSLKGLILLATIFALKAVVDYIIIRNYSKSIGGHFSAFVFLGQELINIVYVPLVAVLSQILPFYWKGRKH
jgi:cellulose synthase/poly-beta-1,6-N-acetylglucosamine synthase-like glycosyltransferase